MSEIDEPSRGRSDAQGEATSAAAVEDATSQAYRRLLERAQATIAGALADGSPDAASPDPPLAPPPCP